MGLLLLWRFLWWLVIQHPLVMMTLSVYVKNATKRLKAAGRKGQKHTTSRKVDRIGNEWEERTVRERVYNSKTGQKNPDPTSNRTQKMGIWGKRKEKRRRPKIP